MIRRTTLLLIILSIFISACTWLSHNIESAEVIAKISARRLGAELQYKYPDIAKELYKVCKIILKDTDTNNAEEQKLLKQYIYELLQQHIEDPILAADFMNLIDIIKIKPNIPLDAEQILIIKTIAEGLMSGIKLTGGGNGNECI